MAKTLWKDKTYQFFLSNHSAKAESYLFRRSYFGPDIKSMPKIIYKMISNHIKQFRELKGLTQEQLAEAVSVSRQTIIAMEKGNYEPSLGLAFKLAKIFKVSVEELFMLK